jgi:hypothetical protein
MFQTNVVGEIKTHVLCSITLSRKSCRLWDNVEKYGRARQATDDSIVRRMRFACWITKATDTHSEFAILIAFPRQQWLRERASLLLLHAYCLCCFPYTVTSFCCRHKCSVFSEFPVIWIFYWLISFWPLYPFRWRLKKFMTPISLSSVAFIAAAYCQSSSSSLRYLPSIPAPAEHSSVVRRGLNRGQRADNKRWCASDGLWTSRSVGTSVEHS